MKILTNIAHPGHQYELWKLPHDFTVVVNIGLRNTGPYPSRPLHEKIKWIDVNDVNIKDYDLIICHIDEFSLATPEFYPRKEKWSEVVHFFMSLDLPKVVICHGTSRFINKGEYDPKRNFRELTIPEKYDQFEEDTEANSIFREFFKDILVIVNSPTAQKDWNFYKSRVITHGFDPKEFYMQDTSSDTIINLVPKMQNRVFCNGYFLYLDILKHLDFPIPPTKIMNNLFAGMTDEQILYTNVGNRERMNSIAIRQFAQYRQFLSKALIYLNTTYRSPMPRARGEAMMSGVIPVTTNNHGVDTFIKNGINGFYSNDPKELADAIKFIKNNPDAAKKLRINARETAIEHFHIDRYLSEWQDVLRGI